MTELDKTVDEACKQMEEIGFTIVKNVIPKSECERMRDAFEKLEAAENKKGIFNDKQRMILWNVHQSNPDVFLDKINIPVLMQIAKKILKEQFSLTHFAGIHNKNSGEAKNLHIDSRVPMRDFQHTFQMIAMMCITDFTVNNGSTYLWPLSHKTGVNPKECFSSDTYPLGKVQCEAKAGDVVVFLGQTWHDVAPNLTNEKRWGLIAYYSRWWVKPSFDFTQCGPELFSKLSPEQKVLLGFTSRPPANPLKRINTVTKVEELPTNYDEALKS